MPTVSVIMPTYTRTRYLREALDSALVQTWPDLEVFVSDNSEDDAVERVVRSYTDPRIRYRRNATNVGGAANFLEAVADAACDVVACLHDDDRWDPAFLERVAVPLIEDQTLTLGFCDFDVIDQDGRADRQHGDYLRRRRHRRGVPPGRLHLGDAAPMAAVLADGLSQPAYAAAFRRGLVAGLTMPHYLDPLFDLWINELACRERVDALYVGDELTHYRIHGASQTAARSFLDQSEQAYRRYVADDAFGPARPDLVRFLARLYVHRAGERLRAGDYAAYRRELGAAAALLPAPRRQASQVLAFAGWAGPVVRGAHVALQASRRRAARTP